MRLRLQFSLRTLLVLLFVGPVAGWLAHEWHDAATRAEERRNALLKRSRRPLTFTFPTASASVPEWPNEGEPQQIRQEN